jgi:predicted RNase H-like nuclease (RuvC/YqgF family)
MAAREKIQATLPTELYQRLEEVGCKNMSESLETVVRFYAENQDIKSDLERQISDQNLIIEEKENIITRSERRITLLEGTLKDREIETSTLRAKNSELEKHIISLKSQIESITTDKENLTKIINDNFKTILSFVERQEKPVIEASYTEQKLIEETKVPEKNSLLHHPFNWVKNKLKV